MTVQAIAWVLDHSTTEGVARLCLIAMANHSNVTTTGAEETWVSIGRVAREANCHVDTARRTIQALHESGHITREVHGSPDTRMPAHRRTNLYTLNLDNGLIAQLAAERGRKALPKRAGNTRPKRRSENDRDLPSKEMTGISDRNARDLPSECPGSPVPNARDLRSPRTLREPLENPQDPFAADFSETLESSAITSPAADAAAGADLASPSPVQLQLPVGGPLEATAASADRDGASADGCEPSTGESAGGGTKPRQRNVMFDAVREFLADASDTGARVNELAVALKERGFTPEMVRVLAGVSEETNPLGRTIGNAKKLAKLGRTVERCQRLAPHIEPAAAVVARLRADFAAGKLKAMGSNSDYATAVAVAERLSLGNDASAVEAVLRQSSVWTANSLGVELGRQERSSAPSRFDPTAERPRVASADPVLERIRAERAAVAAETAARGGGLPPSAVELLSRIRRDRSEGAA